VAAPHLPVWFGILAEHFCVARNGGLGAGVRPDSQSRVEKGLAGLGIGKAANVRHDSHDVDEDVVADPVAQLLREASITSRMSSVTAAA